MLKRIWVCQLALLFCWLGYAAHAQDGSTGIEQTPEIKVIVAVPDASSDSVIAIPPETSWTITLKVGAKHLGAAKHSGDVDEWVQKESALNGLHGAALQPWHIVIAYDQFDRNGNHVHSGVLDELWAGPKKYRISYKSDNLNQTDYATEQGLFRLGDQRWPTPAEMQIRTEVIDPFSYAATLQGVRMKSAHHTFGAHSLDCVGLEPQPEGSGRPAQYCFDPDSSILRYSRGQGWFQTTYNAIVTFQGRSIARQVTVTDGGIPFLNLHVKTLEAISPVDEKDFAPPSDAVNLRGKILSGVSPTIVQTSFPKWPSSLRGKHFTVGVELVVGKDGRVESAHAISGPPAAYKAAEEAAKKWVFQPYLAAGQPAEIDTKTEFGQN